MSAVWLWLIVPCNVLAGIVIGASIVYRLTRRARCENCRAVVTGDVVAHVKECLS